jgi:hypothetical protein
MHSWFRVNIYSKGHCATERSLLRIYTAYTRPVFGTSLLSTSESCRGVLTRCKKANTEAHGQAAEASLLPSDLARMYR